MLLDTGINAEAGVDAGISAQTILLGAVDKALGGCIIRSVNRQKIIQHFNLPRHLEILFVIALGKPKQEIKLVSTKQGKTDYFTDSMGVHCVPKRGLDEILFRPEND